MTSERCPGCDQPMLPDGEIKRENEYDHASGCPLAPAEGNAREESVALQWISDRVREGRGAVNFALTDNGDIGVWIGLGDEQALGIGDDALEAVLFAKERE